MKRKNDALKKNNRSTASKRVPEKKSPCENQLKDRHRRTPGKNRLPIMQYDLFGEPIIPHSPPPLEEENFERRRQKRNPPEHIQQKQPESPRATKKRGPEERSKEKIADCSVDDGTREEEIYSPASDKFPKNSLTVTGAARKLPLKIIEDLKNPKAKKKTSPGNPIIKTKHLLVLLESEWKPREIAKEYGISVQAVRKRISKIKPAARYDALMVRETPDGIPVLNFPEQIREINKVAFEILCMGEPNLKLEAMKRIEKQNMLQIQVAQLQSNLKAVAEFKTIILEALESVDPKIKEAVIAEIKRRRATARAVAY